MFNDILTEKIYEQISEELDVHFESSSVSEEVKARINTRLLLDKISISTLFPGNVYKVDDDNLGSLIYDSVHADSLLNDFSENKSMQPSEIIDGNGKIKSEYKSDWNKFIKKFREQLKIDAISVIVEVSPLCDFIQNKMKLSRVVKGFLCPIRVQINGRVIDVYEKLRKHTNFLYITPIIEYEEKIYRLVIDFRYFSAKNELDSATCIFRLRKEILIDVQTKLSGHVSRPGVLFIE